MVHSPFTVGGEGRVKVPLIMKLLILCLCLQTTYFMEVEKDGTLPFRMCLWLTSAKSHHTDHSVASYRKCTENQHVQTDISTIDLTTSLPPRIESWSITYKPKWCNRSYVIYCIPCQGGNHLYYVIYCNLSFQRIVWIHHLYQAFSQPLWALNIPVKHSLMLSCSSSQIIKLLLWSGPPRIFFHGTGSPRRLPVFRLNCWIWTVDCRRSFCWCSAQRLCDSWNADLPSGGLSWQLGSWQYTHPFTQWLYREPVVEIKF